MNVRIFLDGADVEVSPLVIEALTPGVLTARGVFETIRASKAGIEFLDEHLNRLAHGLKVLRIKSPYHSPELKRIVRRIVRISLNTHPGIKRVRILVWQDAKAVHCAVMALTYTPLSPLIYKKGVTVGLVQTDRRATHQHALVKSLDYKLNASAYAHAKGQGFDEALLVNTKGHIFEASRANVFAHIQGMWMTPPLSSGCLNGIMRQTVLAAARDQGILIKECPIDPELFATASAAFLTNSLVGLLPIDLKSTNPFLPAGK